MNFLKIYRHFSNLVVFALLAVPTLIYDQLLIFKWPLLFSISETYIEFF